MSWPGCNYAESTEGRVAISEMVNAALRAGITLFDTAEAYGLGLAEELLGEALKSLGQRSAAAIVTKVGPVFDRSGRPIENQQFLTRRRIFDCCEASLRRLQSDWIDLYLLHRPDPETPIAESIAALVELQQQGKIRAFGVSNFDAEQLTGALEQGSVSADQVPYNLIERGIEHQLRPLCSARQVGIMAYSPLGKGILSGKYDTGRLPAPQDYRHRQFQFLRENLPRHLAVARRCAEWAVELGVTPSQLALAWCLAQPGIAAVLPGAKGPSQVRENALAGDLFLQPAVTEALSRLSKESLVADA